MYYVYVLLNKENRKLYIGYTSDLKRRFRQHKRNFPKDILIYYEAYLNKKYAIKREQKLKYYGSAWRALKKRILE